MMNSSQFLNVNNASRIMSSENNKNSNRMTSTSPSGIALVNNYTYENQYSPISIGIEKNITQQYRRISQGLLQHQQQPQIKTKRSTMVNSHPHHPHHHSRGENDEAGVDSAPPPRKIYTDDMPVLDSFSGIYGFDLYHPLCEDLYEAGETKPSTAFFYFKDESGWINLYSKKAPTWWNLSYWCQSQPPDNCFLRIVPAYGTSDKQQEVIQRCFEDFTSSKCQGLARYSIVKVGNSQADYLYDKRTNRLCVTLPYERPKEGCEYSQFTGKFMCFNSCLYNGGQGNKKPLYLIITLERPLLNGNNNNDNNTTTAEEADAYEILGRQCLKFRSCACPKRDKDNSERKHNDGPSTCSNLMTPLGNIINNGNNSPNNSVSALANITTTPNNNSNNSVCGKEKRKRTDHNNGVCKRIRPQEQQQHMRDVLSDTDCLSNSDVDIIIRKDTNTTGFSIDGEPFQLLAVPLNIPGALSVIKEMRSALMNLAGFTSYHHVTGKDDESGSCKRLDQMICAETQATTLLRDFYQNTSVNNNNNGQTSRLFNSSSSTESTSSLQTNVTGGATGLSSTLNSSSSTGTSTSQLQLTAPSINNDVTTSNNNGLLSTTNDLDQTTAPFPEIRFPSAFKQMNVSTTTPITGNGGQESSSSFSDYVETRNGTSNYANLISNPSSSCTMDLSPPISLISQHVIGYNQFFTDHHQGQLTYLSNNSSNVVVGPSYSPSFEYANSTPYHHHHHSNHHQSHQRHHQELSPSVVE